MDEQNLGKVAWIKRNPHFIEKPARPAGDASTDPAAAPRSKYWNIEAEKQKWFEDLKARTRPSISTMIRLLVEFSRYDDEELSF